MLGASAVLRVLLTNLLLILSTGNNAVSNTWFVAKKGIVINCSSTKMSAQKIWTISTLPPPQWPTPSPNSSSGWEFNPMR
eukprot:6699098-Ditylum_brightwellii.AAC.1